MSWNINFITESNFKNHVEETILKYGEKLKPVDLKQLNKNIIDPIKMIFDKTVYRSSWEEIINGEIYRQRDKSNNNDIGYFHQRIFKYINNCHVPDNGDEGGWDVIYNDPNGIYIPEGGVVHTVYVEMKNKHNTMNSASASKTFIKMQAQLLNDDDCACFLVESIAKKSQNIKWETTVDGKKVGHKLIRRVSLDKFYEIVTGQRTAFYDVCMALPDAIQNVVDRKKDLLAPVDTAYNELESIAEQTGIENKDLAFCLAIYLLVFSSYVGFNGLIDSKSIDDFVLNERVPVYFKDILKSMCYEKGY